MKIGFNEGCNRFCENHSVLEDLDLCEKYGVDFIDIQSECLDREIAAGKYTIDDLAAWFADPKHHLKMLSYNALVFFNMKETQEEKDAVMAELDKIIDICNKLQCKMIVVVPSMDIEWCMTSARMQSKFFARWSRNATLTESSFPSSSSASLQ